MIAQPEHRKPRLLVVVSGPNGKVQGIPYARFVQLTEAKGFDVTVQDMSQSKPVTPDLPTDLAVLAAVRGSLNAAERREFGYLYREARRNPGCGIRPAIKIALAKMRAKVTERIDRAAEKLGSR